MNNTNTLREGYDEIKRQVSAIRWPSTAELSSDLKIKIINIAKDRGYKDPTTKKAQAYLLYRTFVSQRKDGTFTAFQMTSLKIVEAIHVVPVKARKGTLYVFKNGIKSGGFTIATAHLLDRFAQRTGEADLTRSEAVRKFCKEIMFGHAPAGTSRPDSVMLFTNTGIMLGEKHEDVEMFKTFVSYDTIRPSQKKIMEETFAKMDMEFEKLKQSPEFEKIKKNIPPKMREMMKL